MVTWKLDLGYCYGLPITLQCLGFGGRSLYFGEIGDPGNRLLGFLNSLGVGGVLRLGYIGDLLFLVTSVLGATPVIGFWSFWVFPIY